MIPFLLWSIVLYLLFRFIFNFLIPLITATRQIRTKMKDMQGNVQDFQERNANQPFNDKREQPPQDYKTNSSKGDYIDFEEIK